ncbi:MAG: putative Ig domain-containing protein, partial [Verrucomicrobiota bacterium]
NTPPVFTDDPMELSDALEDSAYNGTLAGTATDADSDPLTYSKVSGPTWLNVATDGTLSGTPSLSDAGANSWSVQVDDGNGGTDSATLEITVNTVLPKDDMALSETTTHGTVSGTLANGQINDDLYEAITEAVDATPTSLLEHEWTFDVYGAELVTFYVEAHRTANSEGDDFVFAYSTDGSSWTDMVTVTKTADDDTVQWYALPSGLNGTVYVRVMDADRSVNNIAQDTIYVDALFIYSEDSTVAPSSATTPAPAAGAIDVPVNQVLSWTAGSMAVTHDVYFGTSPSPAFQVSQSNTTYNPGTLANNTIYYWAVDEVNNSGTTAGTVWSFTTVSAPNTPPQFTADPVVEANGTENAAYSGTIADNATDADSDPLTFSKVSGPTWLSIASDGTLSGTPASGDIGLNSFSVEVSDGNGGTDVASLEITVDAAALPLPGVASDPSPVHRARDISLTPTLSWTAGSDAVSHNVYFGTDSANLVSQGNQTGTTFAPGSLGNKTTYYWRIDEVNASGTTTGSVWQFKT